MENIDEPILRRLFEFCRSMRWEIAALRFHLAQRRALEAKYNPRWQAQPRAPRGTTEGGQWVGNATHQSPKQAAAPRERVQQVPPRAPQPAANDNLEIPRTAPLRFGPAAALATGDAILRSLAHAAEREQVNTALRRFHLDPTVARDVLAARAYVWGVNQAPLLFAEAPFSGAGNERVAQALMRFERANPGTLALAENRDEEAQTFVQEIVTSSAAGEPRTKVIPQTTEEADYVLAMQAAGRSDTQIAYFAVSNSTKG